jgi:hypothetical protein
VQKFTRPITREVELGGERLAFTFTEQGLAVRPLGSRKLPREISWGTVLVHMLGSSEGQAPSPDQIASAAASLKGPAAKSTPKSASELPEHETAVPSTPSPTPTSPESSP